MPFIKGRSGNPRGRPIGARGKKTLAREAAMRAEADAKARAIVYGSLDARIKRALVRPPRAAKPTPAARLPADLVPHDARTAAAAVAALLGVDTETVMDAVGLTGDEAADWFDDAL
jgi:2-methylcitrate dehydratase PrpD